MNKAKIIVSLMAIIGLAVLYSCTKDKGSRLSCDEKAHKYAVIHQATNQSIGRDSLVKLERGLQFAVFRSLTPQNKKRIYNEKIDLLLATLTLNDNERTHLIALKNFNDLSMYESDDEETPFLTQWELTAKNTLGWTDNMIQGMVGTWATPQELIAMAGQYDKKEKDEDCTCNYDISCAAIGDCKGGTCDKTQGGCGLVGKMPCTGNCPEDRIKPSSGIAH